MLDKLGVKWLIRVGTVIWSIACFMTALVSGFGLIILSRLLLGIGETPVFPGSSKATGYWFPVKERGRATSSFDASAKFASALGLPIVALAVSAYGWRAGFVITGILSILYAIAFWFLYRDPGKSKHLSEAEHQYILEGGAQQEHVAPTNLWDNLKFLGRQRKVWGLTLGFTAYNYSFNLFLVWLPGYLQTQLHASVLKSGIYLIIPWLVATLTDLLIGGVLVDRLIASGKEPTRVRKVLLTIGMLMGVAAAGAAFTNNINVAVAWLTVSLAGLAFAAPIAWSIPSLIAPKGTVGTVGSIMNFFGNAAGIVAPIVAGFVADRMGFAPNFLITSAILIAGIFSFLFLLGRIEQIQTPDTGESGIAPTKPALQAE